MREIIGALKNELNQSYHKIHSRDRITIGEYEALHEKWLWEGMQGESLVFCFHDVATLSDDEVERVARSSDVIGPGCHVLVERGDPDFVLVSFHVQC